MLFLGFCQNGGASNYWRDNHGDFHSALFFFKGCFIASPYFFKEY